MECEPVAAEEPAGVGPGQGVDPGGLGVGEADGRDARRAGQSRNGGHGVGAGVNAQVKIGADGTFRAGGRGRLRDGQRFPVRDSLVRKLRRKMMRIWARAVRRVWRFCAVQAVTWDWSQPRVSLKSVTHCRITPAGFQQK